MKIPKFITPFSAAITISVIYGVTLLVFHRELNELPGVMAERASLNILGDSVGGLTAPLALIWLIAAVIMQRQELNLTKTELAKTAAAMDMQVRLMAEQSELQRLVAQANYKVTLFQERFAIYRHLIEIVARLYDDVRYNTAYEVVEHLQKIKFVFGSKVYGRGDRFIGLVNVIKDNLEFYENTFGRFPDRNNDGELIFFKRGPDSEQEMRTLEIDAQLDELLEETTKGDFPLAMREAMELDSDIDIDSDRLK